MTAASSSPMMHQRRRPVMAVVMVLLVATTSLKWHSSAPWTTTTMGVEAFQQPNSAVQHRGLHHTSIFDGGANNAERRRRPLQPRHGGSSSLQENLQKPSNWRRRNMQGGGASAYGVAWSSSSTLLRGSSSDADDSENSTRRRQNSELDEEVSELVHKMSLQLEEFLEQATPNSFIDGTEAYQQEAYEKKETAKPPKQQQPQKQSSSSLNRLEELRSVLSGLSQARGAKESTPAAAVVPAGSNQQPQGRKSETAQPFQSTMPSSSSSSSNLFFVMDSKDDADKSPPSALVKRSQNSKVPPVKAVKEFWGDVTTWPSVDPSKVIPPSRPPPREENLLRKAMSQVWEPPRSKDASGKSGLMRGETGQQQQQGNVMSQFINAMDSLRHKKQQQAASADLETTRGKKQRKPKRPPPVKPDPQVYVGGGQLPQKVAEFMYQPPWVPSSEDDKKKKKKNASPLASSSRNTTTQSSVTERRAATENPAAAVDDVTRKPPLSRKEEKRRNKEVTAEAAEVPTVAKSVEQRSRSSKSVEQPSPGKNSEVSKSRVEMPAPASKQQISRHTGVDRSRAPPRTKPKPPPDPVSQLPDAYKTVMAWAKTESIPPSLKYLYFQLRNHRVDTLANLQRKAGSAGYSRWGEPENRRAKYEVRIMRQRQEEHQPDAGGGRRPMMQFNTTRELPTTLAAENGTRRFPADARDVVRQPMRSVTATTTATPMLQEEDETTESATLLESLPRIWRLMKDWVTDTDGSATDPADMETVGESLVPVDADPAYVPLTWEETQHALPSSASKERAEVPFVAADPQPKVVAISEKTALPQSSTVVQSSVDLEAIVDLSEWGVDEDDEPKVVQKEQIQSPSASEQKAKPASAPSSPIELYLDRTLQVARAAAANKSRWGNMESQKARQQMADLGVMAYHKPKPPPTPPAPETLERAGGSAAVNSVYYLDRTLQVARAATADKSRWGSMENARARQQMAELGVNVPLPLKKDKHDKKQTTDSATVEAAESKGDASADRPQVSRMSMAQLAREWKSMNQADADAGDSSVTLDLASAAPAEQKAEPSTSATAAVPRMSISQLAKEWQTLNQVQDDDDETPSQTATAPTGRDDPSEGPLKEEKETMSRRLPAKWASMLEVVERQTEAQPLLPRNWAALREYTDDSPVPGAPLKAEQDGVPRRWQQMQDWVGSTASVTSSLPSNWAELRAYVSSLFITTPVEDDQPGTEGAARDAEFRCAERNQDPQPTTSQRIETTADETRPPLQTTDNSLYEARSVKVAEAAIIDRSRWGAMENLKAQQMADSLSIPPVQAASAPTESLYRGRTIKVAEADTAGKSRWGTMENMKAQRMSDEIGRPAHSTSDEIKRVTGMRVSQSTSDEIRVVTGVEGGETGVPQCTSDEVSGQSLVSDLQASGPSLHRGRTLKVAEAGKAGKSRWGEMENMKAQQMATRILGNIVDDQLDSEASETSDKIAEVPDKIGSVRPSPLYTRRTMNVARAASAGKSRWGVMENKMAQQMSDTLVPPQGAPVPPQDTPATSSIQSLYRGRTLRVADADASGKSRWGTMENMKAQQMSIEIGGTKDVTTGHPPERDESLTRRSPSNEQQSISVDKVSGAENTEEALQVADKETSRPEPAVISAQSLYRGRTRKVAEADVAGKSRWGAMENMKAQRMSSEISDLTDETRKDQTEASTDKSLYLGRTRKVAEADVAGKSRWGAMENMKAQGMSNEISDLTDETREDHTEAYTDKSLYLGRTRKVAEADVAGKSRWGAMENLKAQRMSTEISDPTDSSRKDHVDAAGRDASTDQSLYRGRTMKVAEADVAGKSRWGAMENMKAQRMSIEISDLANETRKKPVGTRQMSSEILGTPEDNKMKGVSSDTTQVDDPAEAHPTSAASSDDRSTLMKRPEEPAQSLYRGRTLRVAETDSAGKSRWGAMENVKAQQMSADIGTTQGRKDELNNEDLSSDSLKVTGEGGIHQSAAAAAAALYEDRSINVATAARAGKSRWGEMENSKAQQMADALMKQREEPLQGQSLYRGRTVRVAQSDAAGKSRWGAMENAKAQAAMAEALALESSAISDAPPRVSLGELARQWIALQEGADQQAASGDNSGRKPAATTPPTPQRLPDMWATMLEVAAKQTSSQSKLPRNWATLRDYTDASPIPSATREEEDPLPRRWQQMRDWVAGFDASKSRLPQKWEAVRQYAFLRLKSEDAAAAELGGSEKAENLAARDIADSSESLYQARTMKVARAHTAGKSRWGSMENAKAQLMSSETTSDQAMGVGARETHLGSKGASSRPVGQQTIGRTTLFTKRNMNVAKAAAAGKSRWGTMENRKAQQMAETQATKFVPAPTTQSLFRGRTLKVAGASAVGMSRWGQMENLKAQRMSMNMNLLEDIMLLGESVKSGQDEARSIDAPAIKDPKQESGKVRHSGDDLYRGRTLKVAEASGAGRSRWGRMENVKAQQMVSDSTGGRKVGDMSVQMEADAQQSGRSGEVDIQLPRQWAELKSFSDELAYADADLRPSARREALEGRVLLPKQWAELRAYTAGLPEIQVKTDANVQSGTLLPSAYSVVREWAERESVPPSLAQVIFNLRNHKVASYATAGKSRWGPLENVRAENIARAMRRHDADSSQQPYADCGP